MRRIAVIGATGMLGRPVVEALVEAGFKVTALVRDPLAAKRVLPPGTTVLAADVRDEASLRAGLEGQEGLYLSLSVAPGERQGDFHTEAQGLVHIVSAARAAGIARIGYLSALIQDSEDSGWWVLDLWRAALQRIKSSGIPYTIFYPSNFMETLPQRHLMGGALVMMGASHYCNYWIAGRDFGHQVARAFEIPEAANREYVIQGPEPMTYEEAAHRYAQARPKPLRVVKLPLAVLAALGWLSRPMRFNARMMRTVLRYPEEFRATDAWHDLGKPATTIEDFARGA
jgi:uncharacterized protein YbjT (DUF2867 family)